MVISEYKSYVCFAAMAWLEILISYELGWLIKEGIIDTSYTL